MISRELRANMLGKHWTCFNCLRPLMALVFTLGLGSTAFAQTASANAVSLLKKICVDPTSTETMLREAKQAAGAGGWQQGLESQRQPILFLEHLKDTGDPRWQEGPRAGIINSWKLNLPEGIEGKLLLYFVDPRFPDVRQTGCVLTMSSAMSVEDMSGAVEKQFDSSIVAAKLPSHPPKSVWFFTKERPPLRECGRRLVVFAENNTTTLMYEDVVYPEHPEDGIWRESWAATKVCPT